MERAQNEEIPITPPPTSQKICGGTHQVMNRQPHPILSTYKGKQCQLG